MLPKINRLKKENDFGSVFRAGKKAKSEILILKYKVNGKEKTRFGVTVSKKVSKSAAVRNKIKRRILVVCYSFLPKIKKNSDIVFLTLPGIESKNFSEIENGVQDLLYKAGIL